MRPIPRSDAMPDSLLTDQSHESPANPCSRRRFLSGGLAIAAGIAGAGPAAANIGPAVAQRRKKTAIVFGGGSARGFAHIGVVKALEAAGIAPDLIVGCSAGSLVGAFWAAGYGAGEMERIAMEVRDSEIVDLVSGAEAQFGMVTGLRLENFVNRAVRDQPIETLKTPFIAVATEYPSGKLVAFDRGNVGFAVRASCSIPAIFIPPKLDGISYLDGGLVSPLPVETARQYGAELVIAIDVGGTDPVKEADHGIYRLLLRSFEIIGDALRKHEAASADLVVRPTVSRIASSNFDARENLIALGVRAGETLVPVIRELMAAPRS